MAGLPCYVRKIVIEAKCLVTALATKNACISAVQRLMRRSPDQWATNRFWLVDWVVWYLELYVRCQAHNAQAIVSANTEFEPSNDSLRST